LAAPSRALRNAVVELFAGTSTPGPPTIGIELELIPYRIADRGVVPIDQLRHALDGVAHIGFEPGGQLELNPPPQPGVSMACAKLARLVQHVDTRLRRIGVAVAAIGVNPWHTVDQLGLQLRSHRYLAMDAHFARIGPTGRAFMRQTAATQICVGLAAGDEGMQQWRTANLVAPVLAALFANAPVPGARTAICRAADPARSRHGNPPMTIEAYADFAAAAQPLDGTFAGDAAVEAHLSTLFPPVRPRGAYLEFRALDALPMPRLRSAAGLLASLLGHAPTACAAEQICADADPAQLWDIAAGAGRQHPLMRELAARLIDAADAAAGALPAGYL
jgi:glutamate--cysteine ligase